MLRTRRFRISMLALVAMLGLLVAYTGNAVSGEYGQRVSGDWFTILDFQENNRVAITMVGGTVMQGTFSRGRDGIEITAGGATRVLRMTQDGCLDGGPANLYFAGIVCRRT